MATASKRSVRPAPTARARRASAVPRRTRILDAAERLFAARGFHGVSIRDITGAAGVDVALANYHFGSKQGLLEAVFLRRAEDLNAERLARLDALIAAQTAGRRRSRRSSTPSRIPCSTARPAAARAGRATSR